MLVENELKKLKTLDLSYFKDKGHFEEDGAQNYLVFQPMYRYFKRIAGVGSGNYIYFWKSKGLPDKKINSIATSDYSTTPELSHYEISKNYNISSYPPLENCLFGAVSFTTHVDIDQYKYSGYGIGFDRKGEFSFGNGFGTNCIIWGADMSSSAHANNRTENILILGKDFRQGLNNTTIYAEKLYLNNFTENNKKFCLSLHYIGANSYLFVNGTEIDKFKAKDSENVATPLCLGNILKDYSVDNMKKTGLNGYGL